MREGFVARLGLLCAIAVLAGTGNGFAQYGVDTWTTTEGLPQNGNHSVLQARDGYLWVTTYDGLVRFDGVRFTVFDKTNTPGIATNRLGSLFESSDGALWIATELGGVMRYAGGAFTTYTAEHGVPHPNIRGITGDEAGHVWVLAHDRIVVWDDGRFRPASLGIAGPFRASEWDTQIFWTIDGSTLQRFTRGVLSSRSLPPPLRAFPAERYAEDPSGSAWFASRDGRVARLDPAGAVTFDAPVDITYTGHRGQRWHMRVNASLERRLIVPNPGSDETIQARLFYEDRDDNLWLTGDSGLHRVRPRAVTTYSRDEGLADRNVYPIYRDQHGAIWIGGWDVGLSRRLQDGRFVTYSMRDGLASHVTSAIGEDREGRVWVASHHDRRGGLRIFREGRFVEPGREIVPDGSIVNAIYRDRAGDLWFGTTHGLIRDRDGVATRIRVQDGLPSDDVHALAEDTAGDLWIATYGGLARWHAGRLSAWTERDGLPSNAIRALYVDRDNVLWIGTYDGGLGRYKDGRFARITSHDGLYDDGVFQILEDDAGYLWMSSNRGIHRAARKDLAAFADGLTRQVVSMGFGTRDGMRSAECNGGSSPSGAKAFDGTLWFPTQDGVAVIDPHRIAQSAGPVPVIIESVLIDRAPAPLDAPIRMTPTQESVDITYTGISFVQSDRLTFRYRLNGLDRDWVEAGTRRTAYYSHVPPGRYTFTVMAADSSGVWSPRTAELSLVVVPPFWRTWWFAALSVLAVATLAGFGYHRRVSMLERARRAQEVFSRQLIDSQERERRRIAAELHDSLGQQLLVIKNRALLGRLDADGRPAVRAQFDHISDAVTHSIEEVRHIAYNLRPYHLDRLGLTNCVEDMIERVAATSQIEFTTDIASIDGAIPKDMEINLFRIVQECVNNIIKHSESRHAFLRMAREDRRVTITVHDDGKGFDPQATLTAPVPTRGFGMSGIAERVGMLGGRHTVVSSPGQGTTIQIDVPVEASAPPPQRQAPQPQSS